MWATKSASSELFSVSHSQIVITFQPASDNASFAAASLSTFLANLGTQKSSLVFGVLQRGQL